EFSLRSHTKKSESEITPDTSSSPTGNRFSPFDRWTRIKARSSPSGKGKKRILQLSRTRYSPTNPGKSISLSENKFTTFTIGHKNVAQLLWSGNIPSFLILFSRVPSENQIR
ncbi:conserved hypothetical protein, partial [Coccidioides posadasii str. Silveira]